MALNGLEEKDEILFKNEIVYEQHKAVLAHQKRTTAEAEILYESLMTAHTLTEKARRELEEKLNGDFCEFIETLPEWVIHLDPYFLPYLGRKESEEVQISPPKMGSSGQKKRKDIVPASALLPKRRHVEKKDLSEQEFVHKENASFLALCSSPHVESVIPKVIWRYILSFLSKKSDLSVCALVCKKFRELSRSVVKSFTPKSVKLGTVTLELEKMNKIFPNIEKITLPCLSHKICRLLPEKLKVLELSYNPLAPDYVEEEEKKTIFLNLHLLKHCPSLHQINIEVLTEDISCLKNLQLMSSSLKTLEIQNVSG